MKRLDRGVKDWYNNGHTIEIVIDNNYCWPKVQRCSKEDGCNYELCLVQIELEELGWEAWSGQWDDKDYVVTNYPINIEYGWDGEEFWFRPAGTGFWLKVENRE